MIEKEEWMYIRAMGKQETVEPLIGNKWKSIHWLKIRVPENIISELLSTNDYYILFFSLSFKLECLLQLSFLFMLQNLLNEAFKDMGMCLSEL